MVVEFVLGVVLRTSSFWEIQVGLLVLCLQNHTRRYGAAELRVASVIFFSATLGALLEIFSAASRYSWKGEYGTVVALVKVHFLLIDVVTVVTRLLASHCVQTLRQIIDMLSGHESLRKQTNSSKYSMEVLAL